MEAVNIDGYRQMSLLYKVIQVVFLGEHMVGLKRHVRLFPSPVPLASAAQEKVLQEEQQQICSPARMVLKPVSESGGMLDCDLGKETRHITTAFVSGPMCLYQALFSSFVPIPFFLLEG